MYWFVTHWGTIWKILYGITIVLICWKDIRTGYIPDKLIFVLLTLSILQPGGLHGLSSCIAGIGLAFVGCVTTYRVGRPSLGWGDVKLAAVLGLSLPLVNLVYFFLLTGVIGVIWGCITRYYQGPSTFPLGPALCGGWLSGVLLA